MERAVITGIGLVTPIGIGKEEFWRNALKGQSGIGKIKKFNTSGFPTSLGAEVKGFDPKKYIKKVNIANTDITSQFAIASSSLALKDSKLKIGEDSNKIGVIIGTTLGTISFILKQQMILVKNEYSSVHKHLAHMALHNCLSSDVSVEFGLKGISETVSSACISGISALSHAIEKIQTGDYNALFVGAAESAFSPLPYAGLNRINALTNKALKPFDETADGTVLGEGAAMFIVEELQHAIKRNADIYCEIGGMEVLCEGYNHLKRDKWATVAVQTIDKAIQRSNLNSKDIDFINAHGMGLLDFDFFESIALKKYFGNILQGIPITSIKPLIGHPLAAASAIQIAFTALAIKNSIIPHTLNTEKVTKAAPINLVRQRPLKKNIKAALINSFAFGGKCAACVLKKYE